jgi:hypothetical protein
MWIALQYDATKRKWTPSRLFDRVYEKVSYIRSALTQSNNARYSDHHWHIVSDQPNYIECKLIYTVWNPIAMRPDQITAPGHRLVFIDVSTFAGARLPNMEPEAETRPQIIPLE